MGEEQGAYEDLILISKSTKGFEIGIIFTAIMILKKWVSSKIIFLLIRGCFGLLLFWDGVAGKHRR